MSFSAADIPVFSANPFGEVFEQIRKSGPERGGLTADQISDLASKLDDSVARTHAFLDHVIQYDLKWRTSVFQGETEYDEAIEGRIEGGLKFWADATGRLLSELDGFRRYGVYSESIETLRPRLAEVRKMLTPDDEFFEGEELDDLAAGAISADKSGQTTEFRAMGE